jgi:cell division protein FtsB
MRHILTGLMLVGLVTGCAGSNERLLQLQKENQQLQQLLVQARQDIQTLTAEKTTLNEKVADLTKVSGTLQREKRARVEEAEQLRKSMRGFVQLQMNALREFSLRQDFFDYIGAELVNRQYSGDENLTLVDSGNRLPGDGTLLAVRGYFIVPCRLRMLILRPGEELWQVVQVSEVLEVEETGLKQIDLDVPVEVREGDILGFSFSGPVGIPYDEKTGRTLLFSDPLKAGSRLHIPETKGSPRRRAYSIGGVGLFQ